MLSANKSREILLLLLAAVSAFGATATVVTANDESFDAGPSSFFGVLDGDGHPFVYLSGNRKGERKEKTGMKQYT